LAKEDMMMKYRIKWQSKISDAEGQGEGVFEDYQTALDVADELNQRHGSIAHWVGFVFDDEFRALADDAPTTDYEQALARLRSMKQVTTIPGDELINDVSIVFGSAQAAEILAEDRRLFTARDQLVNEFGSLDDFLAEVQTAKDAVEEYESSIMWMEREEEVNDECYRDEIKEEKRQLEAARIFSDDLQKRKREAGL
jgi:chromosome segregation ATPase